MQMRGEKGIQMNEGFFVFILLLLLITGLNRCRSVSLCRKAACLLGILLKLTCPPGPPCQGELDLLVDAHTAFVRTSSFRRGEARLGRQSQARVAEPQRVVRRQRRLEEHLVHGGEVGQESTGSPHVSRTGGVGFPPPRRLPRAVLSSPFVSFQVSSHGHGGLVRCGAVRSGGAGPVTADAPEVSGVSPAGAETTSSDNHYYYWNLVLFD